MGVTEKAILACCGAAAVLCLLPWYSIDAEGAWEEWVDESANAFHFVEGVFGFLGAVATAGLVYADHKGMLPWSRKTRSAAPLAASAIGVLSMMLFFTRGEDAHEAGTRGWEAGRTGWYYLALLAMSAAAFESFVRWSRRAAPPETA